jgi:hypothetical protein
MLGHSIIFLSVLRSSDTDVTKTQFWACIGLLAGIFLFVRGFIMLRYNHDPEIRSVLGWRYVQMFLSASRRLSPLSLF